MQLKRIKTNIIFVGFFILFVFLFSANQTNAYSCSQLNSSAAIPDGFGASFNVQSDEEELIMKTECLDDRVEVEIGNGTELQYVYSKGHVYDDNSWKEIHFSGDEEAGLWFKGSAKAMLDSSEINFSGQKYVVAYICTWVDSTWKCGCRDSVCNQNFWQLQIINKGTSINQQCIDNDRDGYGNPSAYCDFAQVDCDDENDDINPGEVEICDNDVDENCDGIILEECDLGQVICEDKDRDKFDTCSPGQQGDDGRELDCDDTTEYVNPISRETCDNQDNDCDGEIDEDCDGDDDGYCDIYKPFYLNGLDHLDICPFSKDSGTEKGDDCNDDDGNKSPGAREECDQIDNNCNGVTDEDGACCNDLDNDEYDDCNPSIDGDDGKQKDCNDENPNIHPGRDEICDGIDNNCSGLVDPNCECANEETQVCGTDEGECQAGTQICEAGAWSTCIDEIQGQTEVCDDLDNDCDGEIDEGACDGEAPIVYSFDVNPRETHEVVTVSWNVRDDTAIEQTEIWRTSDIAGSVNSDAWELMYTQVANFDDYINGTYTDNPSLGSWWYGIHVVDTSGNIGMEPDGPIKVTIIEASTCEDYDEDGYDNCDYNEYGDDGRQADCNDNEYYSNPGINYETCDTVDNNCNNEVDEGCDYDGDGFCNQVKTIYRSNSMCPRTPFIEGRRGNDCNDNDEELNPGQTELCDGIDNNCNTTIDENCDCTNDTMQDCGSNIGECQTGTQTCQNGDWTYCQGETTAQAEACDGLDNDCNDLTDEDLVPPLNDNQLGVCKDSTKECNGAQGWQNVYIDILNNEYPTEISCDGLDNNCDGRVDENCDCQDGDTEDCGSNTGICQTGIMTCENGEWSICEGGITAREEICGNGIDEDCDESDLECDCTENWSCTIWSTCQNNTQTQVCTDDNDCGTVINKPDEIQDCSIDCVDGDQDGYGDPASSNCLYGERDCDDDNLHINLAAVEICSNYYPNNNPVDDDCDGAANERSSSTAEPACQHQLNSYQFPQTEFTVGESARIDYSINPSLVPLLQIELWRATYSMSGCTQTDLSACAWFMVKSTTNIQESGFFVDDLFLEEETYFYDLRLKDIYGNLTLQGDGGVMPVRVCRDNDGDGFGNPSDHCLNAQVDCDDSNEDIYPGALETCGNEIDEDCDGSDRICDAIIVSLLSPREFKFTNEASIYFDASTMNGKAPYTYVWSSNLGGELYNGLDSGFSARSLAVGQHQITLQVSDTNNQIGNLSFTLEITDSQELFSPIQMFSEGGDLEFLLGENVYFSTWTENGTEPYTYLWESTIDGAIGNSANFEHSVLSEGQHTISLTVTDSVSSTYKDQVDVTIKAGVIIKDMQPSWKLVYEQGEVIYFGTWVVGGVEPYNYTWTSDVDGFLSNEVNFMFNGGDGGIDSREIDVRGEGMVLSVGIHNILLEVSDSVGEVVSKSIKIEIIEAICIDEDHDGYGANQSSVCENYQLDCDDINPDINPGEEEVCPNQVDENCNGTYEDCPLVHSIVSPTNNTYDWGEVINLGIQFSEVIKNVYVDLKDESDVVIKTIVLYDNGYQGDIAKDDKIYSKDEMLLFEPGNYCYQVNKYSIFLGDTSSAMVEDNSQKKCITITNTVPTCTTVVEHGSSEDKFDLVFIADQYTESEISTFVAKVEEAKNYLYDFVPFDVNKEKINVHRVDSVVDLGCKEGAFCGASYARQIASVCPYDNIVILADASFRSYAYLNGGFAVVSAPESRFKWVVIHELGHSFAGLADEYVEGGKTISSYSVGRSINCDTDSECSKWNNYSDTGCYDGCYYNMGYYRSISSGTMRSSGAMNFGAWNIKHINSLFETNYK